jgi:hypothetical protein
MVGPEKDIGIGFRKGCINMCSHFPGIDIPGMRANCPQDFSSPDLQAFETSCKFFLQIFTMQRIELPCNCWRSHFQSPII